MIKSFNEYVKLFEKIEFKDKFIREIQNRINHSDRIAIFLADYVKNNDDNFLDWVELADAFALNPMIITSKNNKPQVMKLTRFLRKILPKDFTSDEIDKFVVNILFNNIETYYEIWHGEKIRKAFDPKNFLIREGELGNSCMSEERCQPYFDLYCENKNVYMLVSLHETKIVARAIVWNALYNDRERVQNIPYHVMDRVYAINFKEEEKMIQYAKEKNWLYYYDNGAHFKDKTGKGYFGEFVVKLDKVKFAHYPYVDNLSYIDLDSKKLSNRKGVFLLHNKDGSMPSCTTCQSEHELECPECGRTGLINGEECKLCDGTGVIPCPDCLNKNISS